MLEDAESHHSQWDEWSKAEVIVLRLLAASRLPAAEQEIVGTLVLFALLRACHVGSPVENAAAWVCTVAARKIGNLRARGIARHLGDEREGVNAPSTGDLPHPDLSDLRQMLLGREVSVQEQLSPMERLVYIAVRQGMSLREAAVSLAMSERDVRIRFRRVCTKLCGILMHLVPPPPLQGELHEVAGRSVDQGRYGVC